MRFKEGDKVILKDFKSHEYGIGIIRLKHFWQQSYTISWYCGNEFQRHSFNKDEDLVPFKEIEVNDYVITKEGLVGKVISISENILVKIDENTYSVKSIFEVTKVEL